MAATVATSDEARVPLLSQDSSLQESGGLNGDFDVRFPVQEAKRGLYRRVSPGDGGPKTSPHQQGNGGAVRGGRSEQAFLPSSRKKQHQYSGSEMIVAVFVVAFDTKKGELVKP